MRILNSQDIDNLSHTPDLIHAIEYAYRIQDQPTTQIPDRIHLSHNQDVYLAMPGRTDQVLGTKLVSVNPKNKIMGIPIIHGAMMLHDVKSGKLIAMLDGRKLTAVRTGAIGATAAKYLAPANSKVLGVIGTGTQAYYQCLMIAGQRDFKQIKIYGRNKEHATSLNNKIAKKLPSIDICPTDDVDRLVEASDVVITATSAAYPLFHYNPKQKKAKTFIAIGSFTPDMQELPDSLYETADQIYVDTLHAIQESGDLIHPLNKGIIDQSQVKGFNTLLKKSSNRKASRIQVFKSVGSAIFDLTVGQMLYEQAVKHAIGIVIDL